MPARVAAPTPVVEFVAVSNSRRLFEPSVQLDAGFMFVAQEVPALKTVVLSVFAPHALSGMNVA